MFDLKTIIVAAVVAIVATFAMGLVGSNQPAVGGETRFPNSNVTVEGFTQGAGVQVISTANSYTLSAAEMDDSNLFEIASIPSTAFTLTLPSTTTLSAARVIPSPGDFREWIIDNQHLAATTTTIVAGSGIDLIAVTAADDVIDGQEKARLSCWRKNDMTVGCIVSELLAAD